MVWQWQHHAITVAKNALGLIQIARVAVQQISELFQETHVFQTQVTLKTDLPLLLNAIPPANNARS
jgi:hypothetical protein